jgi:peptidoglycan-N-acetylglucosamine deacetylase
MGTEGKDLTLTTSWDDGHPLDLRIAELLNKHGLPGTFYVPLQNSRPTMSSSAIRELSECFEIGAHTVHHAVLTSLSLEHARSEIAESKVRLEDITGKPCLVFCFPKGRFRNAHVEMVRDAGFVGARTVELMSLDQPRTQHTIAMMPTTVQAYPLSTLAYYRNALKRFRYPAFRNILRHQPGADWTATTLALLHRARETGGVFHLWGHSWEIDEAGQWQALDRALAAMADASRAASCLTNSELCLNGQ